MATHGTAICRRTFQTMLRAPLSKKQKPSRLSPRGRAHETKDSVVAARSAQDQQDVQQTAERSDERSHIGQGRSIERVVDPVHLIAIEDAEVDELRLGAVARIKLDWQRH